LLALGARQIGVQKVVTQLRQPKTAGLARQRRV
jgi:hypothetical protein